MDGTHGAKGRIRALILGFFAAACLVTTGVQAAVEPTGELVAVGQPIGVKLFSDGVLVIGLSDGESAAKRAGVKEGDIITALGETDIDTIEQLRAELEENGAQEAEMTLRRGSRTLTVSVLPEEGEDGTCHLGAWVRDSMAGIGTMTFYDPGSGTFGALGHGVTDTDTGKLLPLDHGSIMRASVKAVKKGESSAPGELKGEFDLTRDCGTLSANTDRGIFGTLSAEDAASLAGKTLPVAAKDEVTTGKATILSTVSGSETKEYAVEIEKLCTSTGTTRNFLLRVTDEELLAQTGGIVQGMSGSPVIQNGKLIGAVTHVCVNL